ncbi:hypothetical protein BC827DRAFT_1272038 [Russula dissimulans]|nr:hypothetical protein BC827DRAFT_1272038 [Russula dissimulans]
MLDLGPLPETQDNSDTIRLVHVSNSTQKTVSVLHQAWTSRLHPILVINKLDCLVTELKQMPTEAYHHLVQLIEQANVVMGSFFTGEPECMEDNLHWHEECERWLASKKDRNADTQQQQQVDMLMDNKTDYQTHDSY